jgi:hypothetical protein
MQINFLLLISDFIDGPCRLKTAKLAAAVSDKLISGSQSGNQREIKTLN